MALAVPAVITIRNKKRVVQADQTGAVNRMVATVLLLHPRPHRRPTLDVVPRLNRRVSIPVRVLFRLGGRVSRKAHAAKDPLRCRRGDCCHEQRPTTLSR